MGVALLLSAFAWPSAAARPTTLVTHDDLAGRARVEGCDPSCATWVQFPRSRPREIVEATLARSGDSFLVWSRVEGSARELDFFRVPTQPGRPAARLGHLVPGMGGELIWLPGDRVLHVWGCGTGCRGVRVYATSGKTLFDGEASVHETSKDGSVATAAPDGVVRVFDGRSGRSFTSTGDPRAITPAGVRFGGSHTVVARYFPQEERQELELICSVEPGDSDRMSCGVDRVVPTEKSPTLRP